MHVVLEVSVICYYLYDLEKKKEEEEKKRKNVCGRRMYIHILETMRHNSFSSWTTSV